MEGEEATQTDRETQSHQVFPQQMELGNEFVKWEIVGTEPLTIEAETGVKSQRQQNPNLLQLCLPLDVLKETAVPTTRGVARIS